MLQVFERRARGEGPAALGRFLEARRVKTSQGSRTWSKQAVYGLIRNPVYKGVLRYGQDDRFVNTTAVEPIVDAALWAAAQHPNGRKLTPSRSENGGGYLLSGLVRCGGCRYCLQGTTTSRGKRVYRCTKTRAGGRCEAPAWAAADKVEAAAEEAFWALQADLEAEGQKDSDGDLTGLAAALEQAERRLSELEGPDAQDALGEKYLGVFRERRQARDAAEEELGHAQASAGGEPVPDTETLRGAWERMTLQDRRELLGLRFDALALGRDRRLVVFAAGSGPLGLPRRGFKQAPVLEAFPDAPAGARVLAL